jgi:hypothetical protein
VEWDFSSLPDPMIFQRFLDAADYWFGYSDDSSAGSDDPARECFVVVVDDQADGANATGAGDGEAPGNLSVRKVVPTLTSNEHRGLSLNGRC